MSGLKVTILGCGGSRGVPRIGNDWGNCDPSNPKNRRTRNAIFVEKDGFKVLVDCGPDVSQQITSLKTVTYLDAALITHIHPDHTVGLFELQGLIPPDKPMLPIYSSQECINGLKTAYPYMFVEKNGYPMCFDTHTIEEGPLDLGPIDIEVIPMDHGNCKTLGFIFDKKIAYCTDVIDMPDKWFERLKELQLDYFIIECTGYNPMAFHLHYDKAVEWAKRIGAKKTYLTDLRQHTDYDVLLEKCPDGIEPAYDGLILQPS